MSPRKSPPHRILIIAEGQIGDLLLLTPVFRAIRRGIPSATLSLLAVERRPSGSALSEIIGESDHHFLRADPHLSTVLVLRRDLLRALDVPSRLKAELRAVRFLREQRFDMVISAFPDDRFALWAFFSGAKVRIGESHKGLRWAYTSSPVRKKGAGSILDYFSELAVLAGCPVESGATEYVPTTRCEKWAERFLSDRGFRSGRFVIVHPGATGDYKIWPPERFRALIQELAGLSGLPILVCGGPQEESLAGEVGETGRKSIVQTHIETDVERFASLVKRAALVISNDSGPRHIAVAVGTPSLALFRRFHDREWGVYPQSDKIRTVQSREPCPLCPPDECNDRIPPGARFGSACLRSVSVEEVVKVAQTMLRPLSGE
jgi:ADP-heptose:LPS heptosyltransferase